VVTKSFYDFPDKLSGAESKVRVAKRKRESSENPVKLVARKSCYKECPICFNLYKNLSDHIFSLHKVQRTDVLYEGYITNPTSVPECYTKLENGKRVKLSGEELEVRLSYLYTFLFIII